MARVRGPIAVFCACLAIGVGGAATAGAIGFLGGWGERGSGPGEFGFPVSVAVDASGTVYVADSENDRVQRFSEAGAFLGEWGGTGSGPGQFETPEAVAVDRAGNVYVADKGNYRIEKFTGAGTFLSEWGGAGAGAGRFEDPEAIAIDAAGDVYVADAGNDLIQRFGPGGAFVDQWGGSGTGPGKFDAPEGVAVDDEGAVYVADAGNDRIQKFTASGTFLRKWGRTGSGRGELDFPVGVATGAGGRVYVADAVNDRVEVFDGSGRYRSQWGTHGGGPGQLDNPVAIAPSATGRVFVADALNDRIQVFGKLPTPRYGRSVNVGTVRGTIRVRLPGSRRFIVLGADRQLPVGTIVDASAGRVRLSSAKGPGGGTQRADFYAGSFRVLQPRGGRPITVLKLENPLRCRRGHRRVPARAAWDRRKRRRGRGLWGSGKGNFRSQGRHGSATVRGTIWWAADTCRGTLFKVRRGVVTIKDFTTHRKLKLRRGQRYLAKNG